MMIVDLIVTTTTKKNKKKTEINDPTHTYISDSVKYSSNKSWMIFSSFYILSILLHDDDIDGQWMNEWSNKCFYEIMILLRCNLQPTMIFFLVAVVVVC